MKKYTQAKKTQMLTGGIAHFTVTGVDLRTTVDKDSDLENFYEQSRVLESIIEIFRIRANVVLVSETKQDGLSIGVEHNDAIDTAELQEKIRELGTVDFGGETRDLSSVVVSSVVYDLQRTPAPVVNAGNSSIQQVGGDVVITIEASGDNLDRLEVDHNAESVLPEFSIYADSGNVWGDPQSQADADAAGVVATYSNGTWTITLLEGEPALNTWINDFGGYIRMLFVVHNTDGNASGTMSGGNYFELEITVTP